MENPLERMKGRRSSAGGDGPMRKQSSALTAISQASFGQHHGGRHGSVTQLGGSGSRAPSFSGQQQANRERKERRLSKVGAGRGLTTWRIRDWNMCSLNLAVADERGPRPAETGTGRVGTVSQMGPRPGIVCMAVGVVDAVNGA